MFSFCPEPCQLHCQRWMQGLPRTSRPKECLLWGKCFGSLISWPSLLSSSVTWLCLWSWWQIGPWFRNRLESICPNPSSVFAGYVVSGNLPKLFVFHLSHLLNGDFDNSTYLKVLWRLDDIIPAEYLEQPLEPAVGTHSVWVSVYHSSIFYNFTIWWRKSLAALPSCVSVMLEGGTKPSPCAEEGAVGSGAPQQDLGVRFVHVGCADLGVPCESGKVAVGLGVEGCWRSLGFHVCIHFRGLPNKIPQTG